MRKRDRDPTKCHHARFLARAATGAERLSSSHARCIRRQSASCTCQSRAIIPGRPAAGRQPRFKYVIGYFITRCNYRYPRWVTISSNRLFVRRRCADVIEYLNIAIKAAPLMIPCSWLHAIHHDMRDSTRGWNYRFLLLLLILKIFAWQRNNCAGCA